MHLRLGLHLRAWIQLERLELAHVRLPKLDGYMAHLLLLQQGVELLLRNLQSAQIELSRHLALFSFLRANV